MSAQQKNSEGEYCKKQHHEDNAPFSPQSQIKPQKSFYHNMLKTFKCPQCELIFDRASQLDYHYRSIHLGERSQICEICGKGFFRKADLRTHMNIHLGTNICICEVCGKKFNHISNLIRHCRIHEGVKPYTCSICDKRFTQISSLARHKKKIHGTLKESAHQYFGVKKPQANDNTLKENEFMGDITSDEQLIAKYCCELCGESFNSVAHLQQHKKYHTDNIVLLESNNYKKTTIDTVIQDKHHEKTDIESKCQNIDVQKNALIFNQDSIDKDNKVVTLCLPLETVVCVASKQVEENNVVEIENSLSQDYLVGIEEESTDIHMNKTICSYPAQDTINNYKQFQSKDNIIYLHQFNTDSLTFLSREMESNTELAKHNSEDILRSSNSDANIQDYKGASSRDIEKSLNIEINSQTYNPDEDRKYNKPLNDDDYNQLYIDLIDSGLLKFDESRYCNNADTANINLNHTVKSQHATISLPNDIIHNTAVTQNQDLLHNEENLDNLTNSDNIGISNDEPMLQLMQTETGEQFYEFMISNLVEKMQNISCTKDLNDKMEESPNTFTSCKNMNTDPKQNSENNDHIEHQQTLQDLTDISNEFNYAQFDFHREEKNSTVSCHNESEHFQQNSKDECASNVQEKYIHAYNSANLELLENVSHVDFEKYIETNLEMFERLNDENCNEKLLEFVEVADIATESSEFKESSMVCLIQNDNEELLQLIGLQDSQTIEQEPNQDFVQASDLDKDYSNILQDNNKISDCPDNKSTSSVYVKDNISVPENVNNNQSIQSNIAYTKSSEPNLNTNLMNNETMNNEDSEITLEKTRKPKIPLKRFQCSVCKKAFSTAYNYKQHIGIHFTDQQQFHCKECGMSFAWKSTLNKHVANNHNSDRSQKFVCDICPKVYSSVSQVNEHVKRDHLKLRNHICLHCGKSFFKNFDLKMHSRMHTNERPYICGVCGKRFHHQSHIVRHERTHSGDKPYICNICQNTFTQLGSLKAHKQKHKQVGIGILDYIDEDDSVALTKL